MCPDDNDVVSGFNLFDVQYQEFVKSVKIDFWKKYGTEIFILPGGVWIFLFLALKFGGGPNILNFHSINGYAPLVVSLLVGGLLHCKYPAVYLDTYYINQQRKMRKNSVNVVSQEEQY